MIKTPIKVIVRTRPTVEFAYKNININENTGHIAINIPKSAEQGFVNHQQEDWGFTFDKVLQNASQEVVFDICGKELIHSALGGYSGTIMAYGQTGAGKTFTMMGSQIDYKYRGMMPRCISLLFQEIEARYEQQITVGVSYLEIYNEMMYDLLAGGDQNTGLAIQEDNNGYVLVKGLTIKKCQTEEDAIAQLFEGETNRTISEHKLNKASSRSHCVFTVHLEIRSRVESAEKVIISKLNLVDLAGSERTKKTGSEGRTLLEAQFINKSLSFLEQVVVALSEKQRDHIPYRQSKLTNLLKDSIGGNSKTVMIANIWPEKHQLEETISTLKFAQRMMKVTNESSIRVNLDPHVLIKKYEKEIKDLRQELAMHDTLANRGRIQYEPYTPEQQYKQQQIAQQFLNGELEDIDIDSLRQVKELFFQFRNLYRNLVKDLENKNYIPRTEKEPDVSKKKSDQVKPVESVGMEENKHGFGLGKARKDAKPTTNIENLVNIPKDEFKQVDDKAQQEIRKESQITEANKESTIEKRIVNVDKQQAFSDFKNKEGSSINQSIIENINQLKEKKDNILILSEVSIQLKNSIESNKAIIAQKQQNKNQEEIAQGIIDEEEYGTLKELKDLKKKLKQNQDTIRNLKSEINTIDQNIIQSKAALVQKFEEHFLKKYGLTLQDINNPLVNQKEEEYSINDPSEQDDVDQDALAYIRAKNKVTQLQKARKQEKMHK
ncbi:unnamed protein product [Paramecium pentaurelia]|uniref:Kinesin-like protein n=1 Tax=Paramecium pentaurelia TaxID=43138 RepID=A0A8S1Y7R6_9CILI|nr:unnamed protein product [Paramecium pentaurelia]